MYQNIKLVFTIGFFMCILELVSEVYDMGIQKQLLYARIRKIEFENFRNIESGSIDFPNSKSKDFLNGNPSIIGIYGQNGSGKSSVIMALGILKDVLSGKSISDKYRSAIKVGCEKCTLKFTFAMYSKIFDDNGKSMLNHDETACYDVFYNFDITTEADDDDINTTRLKIVNEVLKYRLTSHDGTNLVSKQTFIDTTKPNSNLFGSEFKEGLYTAWDESNRQLYHEYRAIAEAKSQSFIFHPKTLKLMSDCMECIFSNEEFAQASNLNEKIDIIINTDNDQVINKLKIDVENIEKPEDGLFYYISFMFTPVILVQNLRTFGTAYLHVIDTVTTGLTNINTTLPLLLWTNYKNEGVFNIRLSLEMDKPTHVKERFFVRVSKALNAVSDCLETIVPGLKLSIIDLGIKLDAQGDEEHYFEVASSRDGTIIPLKYESDGIRRVVSILSLLIAAYNDESFAVAIDEIDSGIFEYLLGEILSVMVESIKGQLVFTSHNLRPLEVLPPKYLCFTTTNPAKRFTKLSNRGNSNLRDGYFRSIILGSDKDPIYKSTDRYEIELAFYKAGHYEVD